MNIKNLNLVKIKGKSSLSFNLPNELSFGYNRQIIATQQNYSGLAKAFH
jgi:hypothetical protein